MDDTAILTLDRADFIIGAVSMSIVEVAPFSASLKRTRAPNHGNEPCQSTVPPTWPMIQSLSNGLGQGGSTAKVEMSEAAASCETSRAPIDMAALMRAVADFEAARDECMRSSLLALQVC